MYLGATRRREIKIFSFCCVHNVAIACQETMNTKKHPRTPKDTEFDISWYPPYLDCDAAGLI